MSKQTTSAVLPSSINRLTLSFSNWRLESYDRREGNLCWQPVIALRNGLLDGSRQCLLGVPSWIISRPLQPFSHLAQQLSCGDCQISQPSHLSTARCSGSGLGLLKMSRMKISLWTRRELNTRMPIIIDEMDSVGSALLLLSTKCRSWATD